MRWCEGGKDKAVVRRREESKRGTASARTEENDLANGCRGGAVKEEGDREKIVNEIREV